MQTTGLSVGATKVMDPEAIQLLETEDGTQLVVSTLEGGEFVPPCCAFDGRGVSQPENRRPRVTVAIINDTSIGRRPASFNTFSTCLLMLVDSPICCRL